MQSSRSDTPPPKSIPSGPERGDHFHVRRWASCPDCGGAHVEPCTRCDGIGCRPDGSECGTCAGTQVVLCSTCEGADGPFDAEVTWEGRGRVARAVDGPRIERRSVCPKCGGRRPESFWARCTLCHGCHEVDVEVLANGELGRMVIARVVQPFGEVADVVPSLLGWVEGRLKMNAHCEPLRQLRERLLGVHGLQRALGKPLLTRHQLWMLLEVIADPANVMLPHVRRWEYSFRELTFVAKSEGQLQAAASMVELLEQLARRAGKGGTCLGEAK